MNELDHVKNVEDEILSLKEKMENFIEDNKNDGDIEYNFYQTFSEQIDDFKERHQNKFLAFTNKDGFVAFVDEALNIMYIDRVNDFLDYLKNIKFE